MKAEHSLLATAAALMTLIVAGGTIIQWQISAIDRRLQDRTLIFTRQMDDLLARLSRLEKEHIK